MLLKRSGDRGDTGQETKLVLWLVAPDNPILIENTVLDGKKKTFTYPEHG